MPQADAKAALDRMQATGQARCGKLKARWGRFTYDTGFLSDGSQTIKNYRQRFTCYDPATDPYKPAPAGWTASAKDNADAAAFALRYMAAFENADAKAGVPMMEPIADIDAATWLKQPVALRGMFAGGTRKFGQPEWKLNPEGAMHPGAYAQILFLGDYPQLQTHCGVLLLYRDAPGVYHVSQQTIIAITKAAVANGTTTLEAAKKACGG
jgi:hypothetical protein